MASKKQKNKQKKQQQKYYHCSPKKFKVGDYIVPSGLTNYKNYNISSSELIYFCKSKFPHYTIFADAIKGNWFVYEIELCGKPEVGAWDDLASSQPAIVKKFVGTTRGIVDRKFHDIDDINNGKLIYNKTKSKYKSYYSYQKNKKNWAEFEKRYYS